jgi:uncharacterized protein (DUF3084 family)
MDTVKEKLDNMLCRIKQVETLAEELEHHSSQLESHSNQLESHSNELKHLTKKLNKEDDAKQKENYSEFAEKKGIYLCALKHDRFIMHFTTAHLR